MTWRVGFCDGGGPPAWHMAGLRRGYRHCWAARGVALDLWLWVEWRRERTIFGLASDALVTQASREAAEVLVLPNPADSDPRPCLPILPMHHCAQVVAHTLGIRLPWWATPWRLACELRRRGALPYTPATM